MSMYMTIHTHNIHILLTYESFNTGHVTLLQYPYVYVCMYVYIYVCMYVLPDWNKHSYIHTYIHTSIPSTAATTATTTALILPFCLSECKTLYVYMPAAPSTNSFLSNFEVAAVSVM